MAVIDEKTAWRILDEYVKECLQIDNESLLAVFAIGSLPSGYYRPGQSDLDAALIVKDGTEDIWGTCEEYSPRFEALNQKYFTTYKVPKGFGAFPLQQGRLYPPYPPELTHLPQEIARLKIQGKCIYGQYDLTPVPMPTPDDYLRSVQRFAEWWRDNGTPTEELEPSILPDFIRAQVSSFLQIKRGIIEFDKSKQIDRYLASNPPCVDVDALDLVQASVKSGYDFTEGETEKLRSFAIRLQREVYAHLGITETEENGTRAAKWT